MILILSSYYYQFFKYKIVIYLQHTIKNAPKIQKNIYFNDFIIVN